MAAQDYRTEEQGSGEQTETHVMSPRHRLTATKGQAH